MEALFSDYEEVRKSGLFDTEYYVATYPDVAERNVDPLVHYLEEGAREAVRVALLGPDAPTGTFTRWQGETIPW